MMVLYFILPCSAVLAVRKNDHKNLSPSIKLLQYSSYLTLQSGDRSVFF